MSQSGYEAMKSYIMKNKSSYPCEPDGNVPPASSSGVDMIVSGPIGPPEAAGHSDELSLETKSLVLELRDHVVKVYTQREASSSSNITASLKRRPMLKYVRC